MTASPPRHDAEPAGRFATDSYAGTPAAPKAHLRESHPREAPAPPALAVRRLAKRFTVGGSHIDATAGVDLDVRAGEVFGLLGPNGAGKTTLVRQMVGLLRPDAGAITVFGHDVVARPHLASRLVAYLPQDDTALADMPVWLAAETTARLRGLRRRAARQVAESVIDELGLADIARRPIATLSGGQRRLAAVASALVADRPLLVLDEPTTGLDPTARRRVWAALERRRTGDGGAGRGARGGATVVLVTHNVIEAETVLDRVAILDGGRVIASDTPGALKAAIADGVRLDLVWRDDPPPGDPVVARLAAGITPAQAAGRRWSLRMPVAEAREVLARLTAGPAMAALDDFSLATPSLEEVYLAFGGAATDMERE